jgi:hypothetical protein
MMMVQKLLWIHLLVPLTFILLTFSSFNLLNVYGITENPQKNNTLNTETLVDEFLNWWANLPFEEDPQQLENPCVVHNTDSVIFLQDPFEMGSIKNTCKIPHKSMV